MAKHEFAPMVENPALGYWHTLKRAEKGTPDTRIVPGVPFFLFGSHENRCARAQSSVYGDTSGSIHALPSRQSTSKSNSLAMSRSLM